MRLYVIQPQVNGSQHYSARVVLDNVAYRLDFYTGVTEPPGYLSTSSLKTGVWYWDLYDGLGNKLVVGQGLTTGVDLLYPFRARNVPRGKLFVKYNGTSRLDADLTAFEENRATIYYQAYQDVIDSGGAV
jgi:hypothetical protein